MKKELFIESIKSNPKPSSIAMVYYDGRLMSYETIGLIYDSFKLFIKQNSIHNSTRIGVLLDDQFYYFVLGLSILENMSLVQLEYESDEVLRQDINLFHLDYVLVDSLNTLIESYDVGIILYKNCEFSMVRVSNKSMSNFHNVDIAYLSKTSGTSSTPKIVPIEYSMMVYKQRMNIKHFEIDDKTVQIQTVKMSRFISLSNALRVITERGCVLQTNGINVVEIVEYLRKYPVKFIVLVPAGINLLLNYLDELPKKIDLQGIRFVVGGSYLDTSLAQRLIAYHAVVISYYGMTECGSIASSYHAPKGYKEGSVGWAKLECKIIDQEICVRGDAVFKGYENVSNENIFIDGWFKTGDIGWIDEDKYVYITGRKSEMINRSGEKISPYELEKLIIEHKAISDVVVFPCYMENGTEEVGCAVVLNDNQTISLKEIRLFLKNKINVFKMPTKLYCIDEIPLSDNSKVQRKVLYQILNNMNVKTEQLNEESLESLTLSERKILHSFKHILKVKLLSIDDDFFASGGDSLKVNELIVLIEKQFKIELPVDLFLQNRNVRQLARIIDQKYVRKTKYLVELNQIKASITLVCVHSGDGVAINYHHLAKELKNTINVYALELKSKYAQQLSEYTLEYLAKEYLDEIQEVVSGPFILLGDCVGGTLAYELAIQAKSRRMNLEYLIILDTPSRITLSNKSSLSNQVLSKVKRNVHKLKGLSLHDKTQHTIITLGKMGTFFKSWIERKLIQSFNKDQHKKYMKYFNHRTILQMMIKNYSVQYYPDKLIYVLSKGNKNSSKHLEFWTNHTKEVEIHEFNCKHDEFLNRDKVKELTDLIKQTIQTVE